MTFAYTAHLPHFRSGINPGEGTPTRPKVQLYLACGLFCLVSARQFRAQADQPGNLVHPASVLSLVHGREEYSLGEHVEILADPSRQLTITDVASPEWRDKFVPSRQQVPAIGYTDSAIWGGAKF